MCGEEACLHLKAAVHQQVSTKKERHPPEAAAHTCGGQCNAIIEADPQLSTLELGDYFPNCFFFTQAVQFPPLPQTSQS